MDNDAFFEFSLLQKIDNTLIDKLKKLSKATIDINALLLANKPITQTKQAILFEEESNTITTSQDYLACFALANQGDITAQYQLGLKLQQGEGIERDYSQAIHWYETAAKQNHLAAQVNLAKMRYHLSPLHKNYHQAFYWFSKAAPQNHEAQYYLATMYQHGHGVALNLKLAEYWYIKALENDDSAMKKRVVKACLNKYSALIQ
jgi:TPR repeat protein